MNFYLLLSLLFSSELSLVYPQGDINDLIVKRIEVGRCRASCISEFYEPTGQFRDGSNSECTTATDCKCSMCWDYCDMLIEEEQTRKQMCNDNICLDGCKLACKFYRNNQNMEQTPRSSEVFDIKLSNSLLSWNYKTAENSNLKTVFIVFGLKSNGKWEEVDQIAEQKISLAANENQKLASVTIFAVASRGMLTYVTKNLTRNELPMHESINFNALDKLAETETTDLNQQEGSLYLEQWAIYLIVCCVVFLIIIFTGLYYYYFNNKLFTNLRNRHNGPSSIPRSLSANSEFSIDLNSTITHTTRI